MLTQSIHNQNFTGKNKSLLSIHYLFKGIQSLKLNFFILKVANIRCFILIKCSEQEARFKKYDMMS
jgi:hypothetical protein